MNLCNPPVGENDDLDPGAAHEPEHLVEEREPALVTVPRHLTRAMQSADCQAMRRWREAHGEQHVTCKAKAMIRWDAMLAAWAAEQDVPL